MTTTEREAFEAWVKTEWRPDDGAELLAKEFPRFAFAAWQARAALSTALIAPTADAQRCPYCDNSGDVHRADGEWLGECSACKAAPTADAGGLIELLRSLRPEFGAVGSRDVDVRAAQVKIDAAIAALAQPSAASQQAVPPGFALVPMDNGYGETDFGYTFAGIQLEEGDKRLMAMLVRALGTEHPAILDMTALLFRARSAPPSESPAVAALTERDAKRYQWLRAQHEMQDEFEDAEGFTVREPVEHSWTVFKPVRGTFEPVGCFPGELDRAIDAEIERSEGAGNDDA